MTEYEHGFKDAKNLITTFLREACADCMTTSKQYPFESVMAQKYRARSDELYMMISTIENFINYGEINDTECN